MLVVYLRFAYSFHLWGRSLLLLLLVLLQLLLSEHLQVGRVDRLPLRQLHPCGWMEGRQRSQIGQTVTGPERAVLLVKYLQGPERPGGEAATAPGSEWWKPLRTPSLGSRLGHPDP